MSKYRVLIEEGAFEEFEIEADTKEEAEQEAFNRSSLSEPYVSEVEKL